MCCFNKVNLCAILSVHKRIVNKDCTVENNNEVPNVWWEAVQECSKVQQRDIQQCICVRLQCSDECSDW